VDEVQAEVPEVVFSLEGCAYSIVGEEDEFDALAAAKRLVWLTRKGAQLTLQDACRRVLDAKAAATGDKPKYL